MAACSSPQSPRTMAISGAAERVHFERCSRLLARTLATPPRLVRASAALIKSTVRQSRPELLCAAGTWCRYAPPSMPDVRVRLEVTPASPHTAGISILGYPGSGGHGGGDGRDGRGAGAQADGRTHARMAAHVIFVPRKCLADPRRSRCPSASAANHAANARATRRSRGGARSARRLQWLSSPRQRGRTRTCRRVGGARKTRCVPA